VEPSRLGTILGLVAKAGSSSPAWVEFVRAIAWPVVALAAIAAVIFSGTLRGWLVELVRRIRKVSGWGVDVELSERVSNEVKELTEEAFGAFRRRVTTEFDRLVHTYRIDVKRKRLVDEYMRPLLEQRGRRGLGDVRCTVHIEDVLFTETLYQLLDYYPPSTGPRGRTFSIRFGIVGKAWRSRSDQVEGHVPVDRDQLIRDWGMTWDEVAWAGHGRQSFACIVLRDAHGEPVCIVYFDSLDEDAFGANEQEQSQLVELLRDGAARIGLTNDIARICQDLRARSPFISLHKIGTKT
jgi:hypothetical protein